jgi:hypothetical protein
MSTHGFPYRLIVLRHGQSEWNAAGVFTGWENPCLTARGELEAARAGALLAKHEVPPAFAHTSLQRDTTLFPGVVDLAPGGTYPPGSRVLHAAHAVELADVVLAGEQGRADRSQAPNGQCRSCDVLHRSSLSRAPGAVSASGR